MRIEGKALLVRIYIGESDQWHGQPLYHAIVERLRASGAAGATVLRGIEGFGAHAHLHTTRILRLSEDLPVLIEVVDEAEPIHVADRANRAHHRPRKLSPPVRRSGPSSAPPDCEKHGDPLGSKPRQQTGNAPPAS